MEGEGGLLKGAQLSYQPNVRCTIDVLADLLLGVVVADLTSYTTKS